MPVVDKKRKNRLFIWVWLPCSVITVALFYGVIVSFLLTDSRENKAEEKQFFNASVTAENDLNGLRMTSDPPYAVGAS
ncbi:hypothetical protein [Fangia hongkongensis]|uniref:hypothetical protein n=1 Tax=Fangia hongkongensis TaxID=270495 RepID=UPI000360E3BF|nr:hypothetical protein [Fangia hongkongensis]MBK2125940.1 hypothetical protein [Fangia hongkongensis]